MLQQSAERQSDKLLCSGRQTEKPQSEKLHSVSVSWRSASLQSKRQLHVRLKESVVLQHSSGQSSSDARRWKRRRGIAELQK